MTVRNSILAALLFGAITASVAAAEPATAPAKCKKGEVLITVKDRVEGDKAIRLVLSDSKSGKVVADYETSKVFADEIAKYSKGAKVCHQEEGDH